MLEPECINLYLENGKERSFQDRIYRGDKISPAITTSFRPYYLVGGGYSMTDKIKMLGMLDINGIDVARRGYRPDGTCPTITAHGSDTTPKIMIAAQRGRENGQQLEINKTGCTNTLTTVQKDNLIVIKQATQQGYIEAELPAVVDLNYPSSSTRRGRVQDGGKVSPTLTTENQPSVIETEYRIRKLTPRECWRLMGFTDEDFNKASKCNSNSQLYKQAGNSIVVNCLEEIFKQLF